jgi:4-hydroxybenzoate polyprenyltransferase
MVLNDVFDIEQDKAQRSARPLATGAISLRVAARFGMGLMLAGILFASTAGLSGCLLGCAIAVSVLLYNRVLKKTPLAPLMMGMCRTLNVLLGMSYVDSQQAMFCGFEKHHLLIAGGIGVFVAGLTWFARTEARTSNRWLLSFGVAVMALGFVCLSSFPTDLAPSGRLQLKPDSVDLLFGVLAILILYRAVAAIFDPRPARVQVGVVHCLRSLIFLDACVVAIVSHSNMAVLTIALLLPMLTISKWIRTT